MLVKDGVHQGEGHTSNFLGTSLAVASIFAMVTDLFLLKAWPTCAGPHVRGCTSMHPSQLELASGAIPSHRSAPAACSGHTCTDRGSAAGALRADQWPAQAGMGRYQGA